MEFPMEFPIYATVRAFLFNSWLWTHDIPYTTGSHNQLTYLYGFIFSMTCNAISNAKNSTYPTTTTTKSIIFQPLRKYEFEWKKKP